VRGSERFAAWTLALLGVAAIAVPLFAPRDPLSIEQVLSARLLPPFAVDAEGHFHLLGTDRFGRDILVRTMLGARLSLAIGLGGALLAGAVGVAIGLLAGWKRGWFDMIAMAVADVLLAFPRLVLLLLLAALWRPGTGTVVLVLASTGWMSIARLIRSEVQGLRTRPFVEGALVLGIPPARLLVRHILPNALGPAIVATTLGVGNAILLESGLSFLGLGVQPPHPSWGNMIAGGRELIVTAPWIALAPGIALVLTVLACTLAGDALRDRLAGEVGATLRERV
jgi:peptide/nickel transport system permease protein